MAEPEDDGAARAELSAALETLTSRLDEVREANEQQARELRARLLRLEHRLEELEGQPTARLKRRREAVPPEEEAEVPAARGGPEVKRQAKSARRGRKGTRAGNRPGKGPRARRRREADGDVEEG